MLNAAEDESLTIGMEISTLDQDSMAPLPRSTPSFGLREDLPPKKCFPSAIARITPWYLFFGRQKRRFARMTEKMSAMIMTVAMIIMMVILMMIMMTKHTKIKSFG